MRINIFSSGRFRELLFLFFFVSIAVFSGCKSDDDNGDELDDGITGQWILIEMLADPGDGSGVFMPVESAKTITFNEDGTYSSNGDICSFSSDTTTPSEGTYSETENGFSIDCDTPFPLPLSLNIDQGDLIVVFTCIEPCLQKFRRIN